MEGFYCLFIPEARWEFTVTTIITLPVIGLWSAALALNWPKRAALILPALFFEVLASDILALPLGDWFLRGAPKKALDPDNLVDRLQGFFIIVLGEGVFGLVTGSDWGIGFTPRVICAIQALLIYYNIFWLFFTGDQTKTYIHAVYRNRYTALAFQSFVSCST
jgi:low temperature requirement protein LtrA